MKTKNYAALYNAEQDKLAELYIAEKTTENANARKECCQRIEEIRKEWLNAKGLQYGQWVKFSDPIRKMKGVGVLRANVLGPYVEWDDKMGHQQLQFGWPFLLDGTVKLSNRK